jgi:outer membrane protein OmpA-like peptidoglycan-associated protein
MADRAHETFVQEKSENHGASPQERRAQEPNAEAPLPHANSHQEKAAPTPAPPAKPRLISERRREANRRNAKLSPGPRTARGKFHSRTNAVRHGLTSTTVLFGSATAPVDPELQTVLERLQQRYGRDEGETDALLRSVVVELLHQRRAMELEHNCLQNALEGSTAAVSLDQLHRYRTTSRNALLKHLARLHRLPGTGA